MRVATTDLKRVAEDEDRMPTAGMAPTWFLDIHVSLFFFLLYLLQGILESFVNNISCVTIACNRKLCNMPA